jgi:putative addiction module antidote
LADWIAVPLGVREFLLPSGFGVITIVITYWRSAVVELKVRKFGNSLGVVLPKEVINRLHTGDGEPLFLIEDPDGGYRLTPYDPGFEEKMTKADDIINRYRNTLHVLAK